MKHEEVQRKVGDVMGGKVLDLPEFQIYRKGKAEGRVEGRAEGEEERRILADENVELRKEIEKLKSLARA